MPRNGNGTGSAIQLVHAGGETRLYSRTGDDISGSFPDIASAFATTAVLDGELLVRGEAQGGAAASFNALQQRLGRKTVSAKMQDQFPAFVRLYDILFDGDGGFARTALDRAAAAAGSVHVPGWTRTGSTCRN